jgi:hypothetical protein
VNRLESLEDFIDAQRAVLDQTLADIEKLKALKRKAVEDPQSFVENLSHEVGMKFLLS